MRISIISFTGQGMQLSQKIAGLLAQDADGGLTACFYTKCKACVEEGDNSGVMPVETSVGEWAKGQMQERNALLFIGACGIAVRAIAPCLTDKLHDPPVLVMDEKGNYIIPILSGHMGGANRIAAYLAGKTGAVPVVTTATDLNRAFAVDIFARENGCSIAEKSGIVKVSSKVLAGKPLTMSIEPGHSFFGEGKARELSAVPEGIELVPYPPASGADIVVTSEKGEFHASVLLHPREYVIGMGCRKGKSIEELNGLVQRKLRELGISAAQVLALASVSQKSGEPGLVGWCQKEGVLFLTYTAEELQQVQGTFQESPFVLSQVGVGNVCERAALKACGELWAPGAGRRKGTVCGAGGSGKKGTLVLPKHAEDGMTIAIAKREWRVCFYGA